MTISSVSKRVSYDCSMTCHFLVYQLNIHIFKVTCSFFISFGLLAGSSWMYVFIRPVGPYENSPCEPAAPVTHAHQIRSVNMQLTTRSEIIFFSLSTRWCPKQILLIITKMHFYWKTHSIKGYEM